MTHKHDGKQNLSESENNILIEDINMNNKLLFAKHNSSIIRDSSYCLTKMKINVRKIYIFLAIVHLLFKKMIRNFLKAK